MDFTRAHWRLLDAFVKKADVRVIAPAYRLVSFATWREAFDLIVPLYRAKLFRMLDVDPSNEIIIGEEMNHVYPLFPIREAKPAVEKIKH